MWPTHNNILETWWKFDFFKFSDSPSWVLNLVRFVKNIPSLKNAAYHKDRIEVSVDWVTITYGIFLASRCSVKGRPEPSSPQTQALRQDKVWKVKVGTELYHFDIFDDRASFKIIVCRSLNLWDGFRPKIQQRIWLEGTHFTIKFKFSGQQSN